MNTVTTNSPAAAILIRPPRRQDEWAETYLGRMARAMGLRRPWRHDLEALRATLAAYASPAEASDPTDLRGGA